MENQDQEWKEVSPGMWKPEKDGDSIIGVLLDKVPEDKARNMSAKYHLENEQGIFLIWGCAMIDERMIAINVGDKIRVTFVEKKNIAKGKSLNVYKVEVAKPATPPTQSPV